MQPYMAALVAASLLIGGGSGYLISYSMVNDVCAPVRINNDTYKQQLDRDIDSIRRQSESPGSMRQSPLDWGK